MGDLLGCWGSTTDDDEAVADLGLFHGGPCPGDGQRALTQKCTDGHIAFQGAVGSEEKSVARNRISRNAPCPCGSGQKYKHCCYGKGVEDDRGLGSGRQQPQYPIGTVAMYGPDDKTTTKIAAGVILHDGAEPIMKRWVATDVTTNPKM